MYKLDDLYEIGLEDRKTGKRWAGENYGWQSQESFNKLYVAGKLNKTQQAIDRFGNYVYTSAQADPIIGPALRFIGGSAQTITQIIPTPVKQAVSFALSKNQEAAENIAYATGLPVTLTDPTTIADVAMGGASLAAKPAVKTAVKETVEAAANIGRNFPPTPPSTPQFAMAGVGGPQVSIRGGSATLQPPTVNKLTITDPEFIAPGVRQGISQTPANLKARKMLDDSLARLQKRRDELNAGVASGEIEFKGGKWKRLDKKIREERYGEMSSFYNNLDQDPPAYRKKTDKNIDPTNEDVILEQHHLAAKAQTQPFVEAMLNVGDPDDLVALHEYSRMLGVVMGNSRLNMLDAPGPIHRSALAKTVKEKAGNIHQAFNAAGMEPNNKFVQNLLKDASTADDVMRVFSKYVQEYLIPQQNIAKKIVNQYFADYRINLTSTQKTKFDELVSKANKGGD